MGWKDEIARLRYERDDFRRRATTKRKEAVELRKQKRWLDALAADDRAIEYRGYAVQRQEAIAAAKSRSKGHPHD